MSDTTAVESTSTPSQDVAVAGHDSTTPTNQTELKENQPAASVERATDEHPLHSKWTFWFDRKHKTSTDWKENLIQLGTVSTIEEFWNYYVHLERPQNLSKDTDLYLFRETEVPMWETFQEGGCWIIRIPKQDESVGRLWELLLFSAIGEAFQDPEQIVGVVLSVRGKETLLSLWNRHNKNSNTRFVLGAKLRKLLSLESRGNLMEYKPHSKSLQDKSTYRNGKLYTVA